MYILIQTRYTCCLH